MGRRPIIEKFYHILYRTMCLITNHYYIGIHSTDDLEDGYLGSGKHMLRSLQKHGVENHSREILEICATRDTLVEREKQIVNEFLLQDPMYMNIAPG